MNQDDARGKGLWKFNNLLPSNSDLVDKKKCHIANNQKNLDKENMRYNQARWEYFKYEIKKFSIKFSKLLSKNAKLQTLLLENKLKLSECNANYLDNFEYITCKRKLHSFL